MTRKSTLDDMVVGEPEAASEDVFSKRAGIPADHPVALAFTKAQETDQPHRIPTTTPDLVVRALRRVAKDRELGVRVKEEDGAVVFRVQPKRVRSAE